MPRPSKTLVLPVAEAIIRSVVDPTAPRILALNSGVGAGKSYAIGQGVHLAAATRPKSLHLVSAGTYPLLMSVLQPRIAEAGAGMAHFIGGSTSGHPRFIYPNGSIINLVSYRLPSTHNEAKNPWEGTDYSTLWVDEIEQLPSTVFDHSFQRNRLVSWDWNGVEHQPLFVWSGRPGAVYHWMEKAQELASKGRRVAELVFPTRSNWTLSSDYLDNMRASMSYEEFVCVTQEVIGARMPVRGAIYRGFNTARGVAYDVDPVRGTMGVKDPETGYRQSPGNILRLPRLCRDFPTYAAVDFGVSTSAVLFIQEWQINGSPAAVVVDEWCPDVATDTPALVSGIRARGWQLAEVICDPAGDQRSRPAGLMSEVKILRRGVDEDPDGLGPGLGVPVWSRRLSLWQEGCDLVIESHPESGVGWNASARVATVVNGTTITVADNVFSDEENAQGEDQTDVGGFAVGDTVRCEPAYDHGGAEVREIVAITGTEIEFDGAHGLAVGDSVTPTTYADASASHRDYAFLSDGVAYATVLV